MDKKEFLKTVETAVCGDRELNYGRPEDNFKRIADLWKVYLGFDITQRDVAYMMILMKVARLMNNSEHLDSIVDIAGYAACAADNLSEPGSL